MPDTDLVALRRQLHNLPEMGLQLPQTQAAILEALDGLPLEITKGTGSSSVTAVLRGRGQRDGERRAVLLRADMDALPVHETTGLDYAFDGPRMHACGHDLHMTMLIGAARELAGRVDELAGDVVFMFQPGEETDDGASVMIGEGVLDAAGRRVDSAYALHVWAALEPHGTFCTKPGPIMASTHILNVTVVGKGGHGSAPHQAQDPVPVMAEMLTALQVMVSRNLDARDPAVLTTGYVRAGEVCNVIPETAEFSSTIRVFTEENERRLFEQAERLLKGIADAHGVRVEIDVTHLYPATVNDDERTEFAASVIDELFPGRQARWTRPLTAAEDFSRVLAEVPGSFIGLSAVPADADHETAPFNHSAYAVFDDSVVADGAHLLAELAVRDCARHL